MARRYQASEFRIIMENAMLRDVSDETVFLLKDNRELVDCTVQVEAGVVRLTPLSHLEELADYKIVFSKALRFQSGRLFLRDYYVSFRIKDGLAYTPNTVDKTSGDDLFVESNVMPRGKLLSITFNEAGNTVTKSFVSEPEGAQSAPAPEEKRRKERPGPAESAPAGYGPEDEELQDWEDDEYRQGRGWLLWVILGVLLLLAAGGFFLFKLLL